MSESARFKKIGIKIKAQVFIYTIIAMIFFLTVFNVRLIYFLSMLVLSAFAFYYFISIKKKARNLEKMGGAGLFSSKKLKRLAIKEFLSWIFVIISLVLLFSPVNIFYEFAGRFLFSQSYGLKFNFEWTSFFMYYGILVFLSILAELIIALYYRFSEKGYPKDSGYGVWDYFLKKTTPQKLILLLALLSIASIIEEIVFRFTFFNILLIVDFGEYTLISILIITSLAFGLAHYQNGGWIYCVNSTMAGFVFGLAFINLGLWFAWALHFAWNFLIIFQMFLPKIYGKKTEPEVFKFNT
jgi:membrane protease YdiL (CAAX protease family)